MTIEIPPGIVLRGNTDAVHRAHEKWRRQPVDLDLASEPPDPPDAFQSTLREPASVTGPGTFLGGETRTLRFEPSPVPGWWFDRVDLPGSLPIQVSVRNVWKTARNIVLRSGSQHNYMRMVEHIVALRPGLCLDNVLIKVDSGDPPLFECGSENLVRAIESAGFATQALPVSYVTVKEPVTVADDNGGFLTFAPCEPGAPALYMDCAVDFPNAMGKQRIRFNLNRKRFAGAARARTNTTAKTVLYCRTVGKLFADVRNLGYTNRNILIAGARRYWNTPLFMHEGKSLEAVWHRAMLDLLAAVALISDGRFAGRIVSYKAGHALDAEMIGLLYKYGALTRVTPGPGKQNLAG